MLQPVTLRDKKLFDQLTLAIVGQPKTGKSRLASTGRKAVLFLDYDLRSESLAGREGVYALRIADPPHPQNQTAIPETFDILASLEKDKHVNKLSVGGKLLFPDASATEEFKTIVLDSADSLAKASLNCVLSTADKEIKMQVSVAGGRFVNYTPKNWIGWVSDTSMVESIIHRSIATGLDTILVLHEAAEEAADSTEDKPKFTGRVTVYPVRYAKLLKVFNEVWRMKLQPAAGGRWIPVARVCQDFDFNASTCMEGLDAFEQPDIQAVIKKHLERKK